MSIFVYLMLGLPRIKTVSINGYLEFLATAHSSQLSNANMAHRATRLQSGGGKRKKHKVRKIIEDSDDEDNEETTKKPSPQRPPPKRVVKKESPKGEVTTASDYFASSGKAKPARSTPTRSKASAAKKEPETREVVIRTPQKKDTAKKAVAQPSPAETPMRTPRRRKPATSYAEYDRDDDTFLDDAADDIFTAEFKKGNAEQEDISSEDDDISIPPKNSVRDRKRSTTGAKSAVKTNGEDVDMEDIGDSDFVVLDEDECVAVDKIAKKRKSAVPSAGRKRKSLELEDDKLEDGYESPEPTKRGRKPQKVQKTPPAKKVRVKKDEPVESREIQDIFDSIPTVRPPPPPPKSDAPATFNYRAQAERSGPPPGAGSKGIPAGAENCLAGLTFVFTGILDSISREEAQELVKRYGGKVTGAPSSKTSFVVLGNDAGPKKLEVIRKNNIKTINEDGLFEMIQRLPANGGDGKAAQANEVKKKKEEAKVKEMAAEIDKEERRLGVSSATGGGAPGRRGVTEGKSVGDSRLWTVKYAPTSMSQICGNKGQVEKLQRWLRNFPNALKSNFKKAGPDATGNQRAVIIHGPPGIGKTTAAHLVAKMEGYDIIESNASDTRSKKLLEGGLRGVLDNTSLLGYFAGDHKEVESGKKKIVLIMDEVDGMSAGDRGGVGALAQVCKKTHIPMILICNDRRLPKMRPFDHCTLDMTFRRPTVNDIRSRVMTICYREGLKLSPQVIDALVEGTHGDIRQIINMISTAKLDQASMDFDQSKSMSKAWEKHIILKPWDIASKLLAGQMFASHSKATLNDKIELYFNDHEFSHLMIQENYLKPFPAMAKEFSGKMQNLKALQLADQAAESISDGDLVDAMIHGPQQHWSLMPTHAVFSTVRPSSFMSGSMIGQQVAFTSWLGNNSKQGKLTRFIKEIQGHMRLRTSGDRHEIRQQYFPLIWDRIIRRLEEGKEVVEDVIDLMDSYFLTKDDWDAVLELGLGPMDMANVKIMSQAKATFTRLYNLKPHPLPFMKASNVIAPKAAKKDVPDLEEAIEESDEGEDAALLGEGVKQEEDDEDMDVTKDKYVKQAKKSAPKNPATKKTQSKKSKGKGKGRAKDEELDEGGDDDVVEDEDEEDEEEVKPKSRRAHKGKTSTRRGR
ncbi:hypothetical protein GP486_002680 [Trichoglossum hirsutum]|uniref:Replication factor C subunit 1 n=1 Tax=Trichoglossum hirsutum TaxID=265104 RepID=A0A9P8LDV0_9PEZI|nr:hypothetical protein GP486_002680 [Trichoglossum hirsutum]